MMLQSPLRRASGLLALIIAGGYFGLIILAATCLFQTSSPGGMGPVAHHHAADSTTPNSAHSLLCAWACQASSPSTIANIVGVPLTVLVWGGAIVSAQTVYARTVRIPGRPRSPPLRRS
jgi:hypothetical protein